MLHWHHHHHHHQQQHLHHQLVRIGMSWPSPWLLLLLLLLLPLPFGRMIRRILRASNLGATTVSLDPRARCIFLTTMPVLEWELRVRCIIIRIRMILAHDRM
jgi:hypothetical protein